MFAGAALPHAPLLWKPASVSRPPTCAEVVWQGVGTAWGHGSRQLCAGQGHWPLLMPPPLPARAPPLHPLPPALSGCRPPLQVFEEEHHILYLDHGGVIVAVKDSSIPLKVLR